MVNVITSSLYCGTLVICDGKARENDGKIDHALWQCKINFDTTARRKRSKLDWVIQWKKGPTAEREGNNDAPGTEMSIRKMFVDVGIDT